MRENTADFWGDLGGAGGQAAKEFQRAGYVGPQLGLFYEIASGGAAKGQNFLGARAEAALALVVSLGGGPRGKRLTFVLSGGVPSLQPSGVSGE